MNMNTEKRQKSSVFIVNRVVFMNSPARNFNGESGLDAASRGFQAWPRHAEPVWHSGLAHQQPSLAALMERGI